MGFDLTGHALRVFTRVALGATRRVREQPVKRFVSLVEEIEKRVVQRQPAFPQLVEDALEHVRHGGHLVEPEHAGDSLEGVRGSKHAVHDVRRGPGPSDPLPELVQVTLELLEGILGLCEKLEPQLFERVRQEKNAPRSPMTSESANEGLW